MISPQYSNEKPDNHDIVAKIFVLERLLLSFIGAHASFYRNDDRMKSVGSLPGVPYVPAVLSDESFNDAVITATPPERLSDYTDDFTDNFINYLESNKRWAIDYPSYKWLHNKISTLSGNFHGIGAKGCSPHKKHLNAFVSRYFRGSLTAQLRNRYQNLKRLKTIIESHISLQKFNIIEIMGCHIWLHADKKMFLQIETHMSIRYGFEKTDLNDSLLTVSPDILRFNSVAIETGNVTFASLDSFVTTDMTSQRVLSSETSGNNMDLNIEKLEINQSPIAKEGSDNKKSGIKQSSQKTRKQSLSLFPEANSEEKENENDSSFESIENEGEIALQAAKSIIEISSTISDPQDQNQIPSSSDVKTARKPEELQNKPLGTFNRPVNHDKAKEERLRLTTRQQTKRKLAVNEKQKEPSKKAKK